jgi:hypothetical protein
MHMTSDNLATPPPLVLFGNTVLYPPPQKKECHILSEWHHRDNEEYFLIEKNVK